MQSRIRFAGAATYIYRLTLTTGGFVDQSLYDTFNSVVRQSAFVLRGYFFAPPYGFRPPAFGACIEAYLVAADTGLQLHGGYGYMREYPIAQHYADHPLHKIMTTFPALSGLP